MFCVFLRLSILFGPMLKIKMMKSHIPKRILLGSGNEDRFKSIFYKLIGNNPSILGRPELCNGRCRIAIHSHAQWERHHFVIRQLLFEKQSITVICHRHILAPIMIAKPEATPEQKIKKYPLPPKNAIMCVITDPEKREWRHLIVKNISVRVIQGNNGPSNPRIMTQCA